MSRSFKVISPGNTEDSWYWEVHTRKGTLIARGVADSRDTALEQANKVKEMHELQLEPAPA